MKYPDNLKDQGTERMLISTIIEYGKDTYIDVCDLIEESDFSISQNKLIFRCIKELSENPSSETFDIESIEAKARQFGMEDVFAQPKMQQYLEVLKEGTFNTNRVREFAVQIKKLSYARQLYLTMQQSTQYLEGITGDEKVGEIIGQCEEKLHDCVNNLDSNDEIVKIGDSIMDMVQEYLDQDVVDQIGIPTGFTYWDRAIGGGLRPGGVYITGARPKSGKSMMSLNRALNVSRLGIPVLILDSEMTQDDQKSRLISMSSGCPLSEFETRKFKNDKKQTKAVVDAASELKNLPLSYSSISGMNPHETINIMRRWVTKNVGFDETGKALPCVIFYDYFKLTSGEGLNSSLKEYQILGLALTQFTTFATKYGVAIDAYIQINREGINSNQSDIVAGSDRILWLCSSLSVLKNKDRADRDNGCGNEYGNKKIIVVDTRHGEGLEENDYVNIKAMARPGVADSEATGRMTEGEKYSNITTMGLNSEQEL